jgi:hypothetical protein
VLTDEDVRKALTMKEAVDASAVAFRDLSEGRTKVCMLQRWVHRIDPPSVCCSNRERIYWVYARCALNFPRTDPRLRLG